MKNDKTVSIQLLGSCIKESSFSNHCHTVPVSVKEFKSVKIELDEKSKSSFKFLN